MQSSVTLEHLIEYLSATPTEEPEPELPENVDEEEDRPFTGDNIRVLKVNEMEPASKFPETFKNIFKNFSAQVYRCGILKEDVVSKKNVNISLLFSLLFCIKEDFASMKQSEQLVYIHTLKEKLLYKLSHDKAFQTYKYKQLGWSRNNLMQDIRDYKNSSIVLRYIADFFDINIFLFNFDDQKIYLIYPESQFNKYKINVFLACISKNFEPILFAKNKCWAYNMPIFTQIIENHAEDFMIVTTDLKNTEAEKTFIMTDTCLVEEDEKEEKEEEKEDDEPESTKEKSDEERTESAIVYSNKKPKKEGGKNLKKKIKVV